MYYVGIRISQNSNVVCLLYQGKMSTRIVLQLFSRPLWLEMHLHDLLFPKIVFLHHVLHFLTLMMRMASLVETQVIIKNG